MKKQKIVKKLTKAFIFCLCCVFCVGVLCSTALTVYGTDTPTHVGDGKFVTHITDLTNTTWTLIDIVSLDEGMHYYDIAFESNGNPYHGIQFSNWYDSETGSGENYIRYVNTLTDDYIDVFVGSIHSEILTLQTSNEYLTITISGGEDVQDMWLINWLYANGTLIIEPDILSFSIHDFDSGEIIGSYSYLEGMTFGEWVNSEYNVDGFTIYSGQTEDGLTSNFGFNFTVADILSTGQCYIDCIILSTHGMFPVTDDYLIQSVLAYTLTPTILYNSCFHNGYLTGFDSGYDTGYDDGENLGHQIGYNEGFVDGKTEGQSSSIGQNLIGGGFTAITDALNQIIVYQSSTGTVVTLWVIISGVIGIAIFIWILKLFAGG